jgi:type III pantothenate kinase
MARREDAVWRPLPALDYDDPHAVDQALELLSDAEFERVYLATVSKGWRAERLDHLLSGIRQPVTRIESCAEMGRLRIAYAQPRQLGVDRFLGLLAACDAVVDCAVLSFGTALTLDVLAADGHHRGGLIAPSPDFQWLRMCDHFPGLFEGEGEAGFLADNTLDALASGIQHQTLGMIGRVLAGAFTERPVKLLVTGGGAEPWLKHLPMAEAAPDLVFNGMLRYIELSGL